jgi:pimeloyl-ACP methyl ester carboxylesterase
MHFSADDLVLLCGLLALGLVLAFVAVTAYTAWMLTHPYRRTYASAVSKGRAGEPGELRRADGTPRAFTSWELNWGALKLPVWDVTGDDPSGPVFVLSHGWGDSRIGALSRIEHLAPVASRLVMWDMPGHGEAPGRCSLGVREVGALQTLVEQVGAPVVLYGWSLGAGVSIAAASDKSVGLVGRLVAVIAEAPYRVPLTPARNVIASWGLPWRGVLPMALKLIGVEFDRAVQAQALACPLLVIHGEHDEVCPVHDGEAIARAAGRGATLVVVPGAGHHGLWTTPEHAERCGESVADFLSQVKAEDALNSGHAQQSHG